MPTPKKNPVKGLNRFEDRDTVMSTIAVTKAGDGLSKALAVAPEEHALHDTVFVVLQTQVTRIQHEDCSEKDLKQVRADGHKISEYGGVKRVHTLTTELATVVSGDLVAEVLQKQKEANLEIERKRLEAEGVHELPLGEERDADDEG